MSIWFSPVSRSVVTQYSQSPAAGLSAASMLASPGFAIGVALYTPLSRQRLGGISLRFETKILDKEKLRFDETLLELGLENESCQIENAAMLKQRETVLVDGDVRDFGDVKYLLSPKDLAGFRAVPELAAIGVTHAIVPTFRPDALAEIGQSLNATYAQA